MSPADSVSTAFEAAAAKHAERDFLHVPLEACSAYAAHDLTLRYAEARSRVAAIAARLGAAGYGPGQRIAVALDNRIEFFLYFLALNSLGISIVPLNAAMSTQELGFILSHCDAALALTHAGHAGHVGACLPRLAALHVVAERGARLASGGAASCGRAQ